MQGKVIGNSLVIIDSFALPVQGTETRVNAASEANEYMVEYKNKSERVRCSSFNLALYLHTAFVGWTIRERYRLVSFSSRIWMLVIRY
jgi:hypothetical protein